MKNAECKIENGELVMTNNEKARREGEIRTTIPMLYLEAEKQR
jgi:hypothetical protein